jgi:hypothetical protein
MSWGGRMPKQVTLNFDWEPSVGPNGEITFYVKINRTRISIALWLERLRASQLVSRLLRVEFRKSKLPSILIRMGS